VARALFPRALRLRKRREFLRVQDGPALRVRAGSFLLLGRPGRPDAPSRLGIVASRRLGGAVQRNRAKRLLREAFRLHHHELPPGLDLVAIAHAPIVGSRLSRVERDLARARADLARLVAAMAAASTER
jgi:ribonuclease P protein component